MPRIMQNENRGSLLLFCSHCDRSNNHKDNIQNRRSIRLDKTKNRQKNVHGKNDNVFLQRQIPTLLAGAEITEVCKLREKDIEKPTDKYMTIHEFSHRADLLIAYLHRKPISEEYLYNGKSRKDKPNKKDEGLQHSLIHLLSPFGLLGNHQ